MTNERWHEPDREFTPSSTSLQAVWPSLRHGQYLWKVVSGETVEQWAFIHREEPLSYNDYHCTAQEVLACGTTKVCYEGYHNYSYFIHSSSTV